MSTSPGEPPQTPWGVSGYAKTGCLGAVFIIAIVSIISFLFFNEKHLDDSRVTEKVHIEAPAPQRFKIQIPESEPEAGSIVPEPEKAAPAPDAEEPSPFATPSQIQQTEGSYNDLDHLAATDDPIVENVAPHPPGRRTVRRETCYGDEYGSEGAAR